MNCKNFDDFGSLYIDHALSEEERVDFEAHLEGCEECRMKLKNLQLIVESINEIEEVDLPDNFSASLRQKLEQVEAQKHRKKYPWLNRKFYSTIAAGLLLGVVATAMLTQGNWYHTERSNDAAPREMAENLEVAPHGVAGDTGNMGFAMDENKFVAKEGENMGEMGIASAPPVERAEIRQQRKLIEEGYLTIETDQYDQAYQRVMELVESHQGYVEQEDSYYHMVDREIPESSLKNTSLVLRIPSESFRAVFEGIKETGVVVYQSTNAKDVTLQYADIENEVLNLEIQENRLREILQQAEQVEDILRIENELNRVRTQINEYRGTLKNLDQLVSLSTIRLELHEVENSGIKIKSSNKGIWSRAVDQMVHTVNDMIFVSQMIFIRLFGLLPLILVIAVLGIPLGMFIYKKFKRRNE